MMMVVWMYVEMSGLTIHHTKFICVDVWMIDYILHRVCQFIYTWTTKNNDGVLITKVSGCGLWYCLSSSWSWSSSQWSSSSSWISFSSLPRLSAHKQKTQAAQAQANITINIIWFLFGAKLACCVILQITTSTSTHGDKPYSTPQRKFLEAFSQQNKQ